MCLPPKTPTEHHPKCRAPDARRNCDKSPPAQYLNFVGASRFGKAPLFWGGTLHGSPTARKCPGFFERSVLEKVTPARGRSERYSSWGLGNAPQRRMRIQWHDIQRAGVKKAKCSLEAMLGCEISEAPGLGASLLIWHDSHTTRRASIYHFSQWARVINKSCLLIHCSHCIWRFSSRSYKHK